MYIVELPIAIVVRIDVELGGAFFGFVEDQRERLVAENQLAVSWAIEGSGFLLDACVAVRQQATDRRIAACFGNGAGWNKGRGDAIGRAR
jgi:hypothetical protein